MQKLVQSLSQSQAEAELGTEQKGYKCSTAIDRWKKWGDDYKKIIKKNKANWTDKSFPSGKTESLYWTKYTGN